MDFRILGPLEVVRDGEALDLGRPKQRALLALLLLRPNQVVSSERLIDELWRDAQPEDPSGALQVQVSRLRRALCGSGAEGESLIAKQKAGYLVRIEPDQLDAWRFERLVTDARVALNEGRPATACQTVSAALELWRGPVLADFADAEFAQGDIARLSELRLVGTETLVDAKLALGLHRELVGELDALVSEHPLRERFWGQRMLALYRSGRQADALRSYQELRRVLGEQLGIEPSPALAELERATLVQDPDLDWPTATSTSPRLPRREGQLGSLSTSPKSRSNLPIQLTTFVGREAEQVEVAALLEGPGRLVTLTGAPGCGKSRLAVEVAAKVEPLPPDGVWLVDVSPLRDPALVARAVASAVGVWEEARTHLLDTLAAALSQKHLVLVLDNCEHLLDECARVVRTLLKRCPHVRVLATSRQSLAVAKETTFEVAPLSLPLSKEASFESIARSEAVQLFVQRAALVRADFVLTHENAHAVASLCERLDGLALAVELAAARAGDLSLAQIAAGLADRFRLLTGASPLLPARQQSLGAALRWSHDLLSASERALLRRLSVFAGGFSAETAKEVCADAQVEAAGIDELIDSLVAKSLLVSDPLASPSRHHLLDTIRHYASERLMEAGETARFRERHAKWCLALAERFDAEWLGSQRLWLARLEAEHDNLRAAFEWAMAHRRSQWSLRLVAALAMFWRARGHYSEGRAWSEASLEAGSAATSLPRAKAAWTAGLMAAMLGDFPAAVSRAEESLPIFRDLEDLSGWARSLLLLGNAALITKGAEDAVALLEESSALARKAGDNWCLAHALANLGQALEAEGDGEAARPRYEECITVARLANDDQGLALGLTMLGLMALNHGDYRGAAPLLSEALSVTEQVDDPYAEAKVLYYLGALNAAQGTHERARELLEQSVSIARGVGGPGHALFGPLCALAELALGDERFGDARALFEEALKLARRDGLPAVLVLQGLGDTGHATRDHASARRYFDEALAEGRRAGHSRDVAAAFQGLADLARCEHDHKSAHSLYRETLLLQRASGDLPSLTNTLESLAGVAAAVSDGRRAARLFGAAQSLRDANGYARGRRALARYEADVELARAQCGEDFDQAWQEGRAMSVEEAVSFALHEDEDEAGRGA